MAGTLSPANAAMLKRATHAALAAIGGADQAQNFTRVSARDLRKCADHDVGNAARFVALDVASELDLAAREPIMARALARLSGCAVVRTDADPHARAIHALKESGEAVSAIAGLVAGGAWGREAAKAARDEIRESIAALVALELELNRQIEGKR